MPTTACSQPPPQHTGPLGHLLDAALAAAQPAVGLGTCLPAPPEGRTVAVSAGKAAAAMAQAPGDSIIAGPTLTNANDFLAIVIDDH